MTALVIYDQLVDIDTMALEGQVAATHKEAATLEEDITKIQEESYRVAAMLNQDPEVASLVAEIDKAEREVQSVLNPRTNKPESLEPTPEEYIASAASASAAEAPYTVPPSLVKDSSQLALETELKALYRVLSKFTHPDSNGSDKHTRALFPVVTRLYKDKNLSALREIYLSLKEYQEAKKSNKKRKSLLARNLKTAKDRLWNIRQQFNQFKASLNYKLVITYRKEGRDAAKTLHMALLRDTLRAKNQQLAMIQQRSFFLSNSTSTRATGFFTF